MADEQNNDSPEVPETPADPAPAADAPPVPPVPPATPAGTVSGADLPDDAKTMAMLCHLLGITVIGAVIIWLLKKDDHPFIDQEGKEATNFAILLAIGYVVSSALTFVCIGAILGPIIFIVALIFCIMGAMKAKEGQPYRYPLNIRFIK